MKYQLSLMREGVTGSVCQESGSSRPRVKSARVNSARSTRPVWGPRYGGRLVRLESGCICLSICMSVNT